MSRVLQEAIDDPETSPAVRNAMKRFQATLRIKELEELNAEMLAALKGLVEGVTAEVNEKGGGGFVLARLTDARAVIIKAESH